MTNSTRTAMDALQDTKLPDYAVTALHLAEHPQERTQAFHMLFDAPLREEAPDETFSHMDDQRVAFRIAFILSEAFEILEKGLGLHVSIRVNAPQHETHFAYGSNNSELTNAIFSAMMQGSKRDVVEVVDGLGDLNVVVNGFALELGAYMPDIDQEILASNFTKLDREGNPIVSDGTDGHPAGKIIKGPNFVEPNIRYLLGLVKPE